MSKLTDTVRRHHGKLAEVLAQHVEAIRDANSRADAPGFAAFLRNELLPHARAEERHLYPKVDLLMREHGRATATMLIDHEFITKYVDQIEKTALELSASSAQQRPILLKRLGELAIRLDAIMELHLAKEERAYLPVMEEHLSELEQNRILDAMHSGG
ncbi:MAG TPA: hemerythrin domain-containing protein [Candidatus Binataceae bacterium]